MVHSPLLLALKRPCYETYIFGRFLLKLSRIKRHEIVHFAVKGKLWICNEPSIFFIRFCLLVSQVIHYHHIMIEVITVVINITIIIRSSGRPSPSPCPATQLVEINLASEGKAFPGAQDRWTWKETWGQGDGGQVGHQGENQFCRSAEVLVGSASRPFPSFVSTSRRCLWGGADAGADNRPSHFGILPPHPHLSSLQILRTRNLHQLQLQLQ